MTLARKQQTALSHYDPIKGRLTILGKQEAIKQARRARNHVALDAAITDKLTEQRKFVLWWDTEAERRTRMDSSAGPGRGKRGVKPYPKKETRFLAPEDFGLTVKILSGWRTKLQDAATFAKTLAAEKEHARRRLECDLSQAEVQRDLRRADLQTREIPPGQFRVLYADPPWSYGNSGVINDEDSYGRAARHYPSMTIDELCAMDVIDRVADDAVLFLWVTSPLLAECWPVIEAWGFTYKTSMVWDKVAHNYGSYVSVRHEFLLICTRGSCLPDHPTPMPDSVMTIERSSTHSEKPTAFRALIDQLYDGDASAKLELFARADVEGWTPWGNAIKSVPA